MKLTIGDNLRHCRAKDAGEQTNAHNQALNSDSTLWCPPNEIYPTAEHPGEGNAPELGSYSICSYPL